MYSNKHKSSNIALLFVIHVEDLMALSTNFIPITGLEKAQ